MEKERLERYKMKIKLIGIRLTQSEEWLSDEGDKSRLACYKAFQEGIEAITDLIAMILADSDDVVNDDYTNIDKISSRLRLTGEEIKVLEEANGLRNRITHKYNKTDDGLAKESIIKLVPILIKITEKIKNEIKD